MMQKSMGILQWRFHEVALHPLFPDHGKAFTFYAVAVVDLIDSLV